MDRLQFSGQARTANGIVETALFDWTASPLARLKNAMSAPLSMGEIWINPYWEWSF